VYYKSDPHFLSKAIVEQGSADHQIREIVQLVGEWLNPTMIDLFQLVMET